jgi:hypothetical protein
MNNVSVDEEIIQFVNEIITGIELKIYNQLVEQDKLDIIKTSDIMFMGMNYLEIYLNIIYKGLIEKTDVFICEKISNFSDIYKIEGKFILNVLSNIIMKTYPKFPRSKLISNSKEEYINSIHEILEIMRKYICYTFESDMEKLLKVYNKN